MSLSMFRSPQDDSSSESSYISSEGDQETAHRPEQSGDSSSTRNVEPVSSVEAEPSAREILGGDSLYGDLGFRDIPDVDAEGHAALMTAALLEHYCLTKACGILNEQSGSRGQFTHDSPEVKLLGRRLYTYKSKFLSSHGIVAPGVDNDTWESTRQYYREGLDTIGMAALDGINLSPRKTVRASREDPFKALDAQDHPAVEDTTSNRVIRMKQSTNIDLQRLITGGADVPSNQNQFAPGILDRLQRQSTPLARPISIPFLYSHPSGIGGSRYATEFEEEALIGRGSYGVVYRVRHHVDGQGYAVKKIPLSSRKLQQLQERGLKEVDNILKEIRTLAKLEHINVVRYYGAWAEYSPTPVASRSSSPPKRQQTLLNQPYSEYDGGTSSCGIVFEESDNGIIFGEPTASSQAEPHEEESEPSMDRLSVGDHDRRRSSFATVSSDRSRKSFAASVEEDETDTNDDDHVESIPRQLSFTYSGQSSVSESGADIFSDGLGGGGSNMQLDRKTRADTSAPVILHIQMSLHPLSLAKYLSPQADSGSTNVNRHCYHIVPSIKLLLGILSGVDYLHAKGIVHRDLKPANVFLSPSDTEKDTCMCPICDHHGQDDKAYYTIPRIGDFGLVAESPTYGKNEVPETTPKAIRPVGTEFYRPPPHSFHTQATGPHPHTDNSLDIYALGVILFELLYKIDTRMERQMVLSNLTCSPNSLPQFGASMSPEKDTTLFPALPSDFTEKILRNCIHQRRFKDVSDDNDGDHAILTAKNIAKRLALCITGMVELDIQRRSTCKIVREELEEICDLAERILKGE
ncbi:translation initiation factor eIF-2 alpha chain kinase [Arthroderma uncinatum]|uniref:translation initiation factor eIF-2 alpha chain kinase n=1 Tax=Arthroderma uncinatum TaxID=74035 RepID=UPI00144AADE3|nr:translation initiation factor eIF-2 alpha chain kinase [Arthroderma uncinatum]KAF3483306.1 translation initiation factor eIF-2 alpha chain kinase [Arthroderma uncinatum]